MWGGCRRACRKRQERRKRRQRTPLVIAMDYGGQDDIVEACRSISNKAKACLIDSDAIMATVFEQQLQTKCCEFPCPDLFIRTSGDQRISNYMLWQLAYAELFFVDQLWPDFGEAEFLEALRWCQQCSRRFGRS